MKESIHFNSADTPTQSLSEKAVDYNLLSDMDTLDTGCWEIKEMGNKGLVSSNPFPECTATLDTSIRFYLKDTCEMLRISPDGFYVRGVKVPQDENEAQAVYAAFRDWMSGLGMRV